MCARQSEMREDPANVGTVTLAPTQNVAQEAVCTNSAIQRIVVTLAERRDPAAHAVLRVTRFSPWAGRAI